MCASSASSWYETAQPCLQALSARPYLQILKHNPQTLSPRSPNRPKSWNLVASHLLLAHASTCSCQTHISKSCSGGRDTESKREKAAECGNGCCVSVSHTVRALQGVSSPFPCFASRANLWFANSDNPDCQEVQNVEMEHLTLVHNHNHGHQVPHSIHDKLCVERVIS